MEINRSGGIYSIVYVKLPEGWDTVKIYIYNKIGAPVPQPLPEWPGVEMEDMGDGLYRYILSTTWAGIEHKVIFNNGNGNEQIPEPAFTEGFSIKPGESKIYTDGRWQDYTEN